MYQKWSFVLTVLSIRGHIDKVLRTLNNTAEMKRMTGAELESSAAKYEQIYIFSHIQT